MKFDGSFRTGDLLIWRTTTFFDSLGENTILLPGCHVGLIIKGNKISRYSFCGKSPSNTYVTFLVDKIYPIEEVIGYIWCRPNGVSLSLLRRCSNRKISEKKVVQIYEKLLQMPKRPSSETIFLAVTAYLRMGSLCSVNGENNKKYHFCPSFISYILAGVGIVDPHINHNNLLPIDFYNLNFHQREKYRRIDLFDKKTYEYRWLFICPLVRWNLIEKEPQTCSLIEHLLKDYDYPRLNKENKIFT